ncbi:MAG: transcription elongation factor GreA [Bacilli bacterium]|nr:transcription elongation factor GreA [Bacilli bacterium]MDD3422017.1 transcription elongation factor GreA [Bacilli bacterium]MDD4065390.1 transcription elongation factor GreA [Bacilli bacterium]
MAKILLTKEGLQQLQDELDNLKNVERQKVIDELKDARAQGDLSENADYDAARNRQSQVESRINEVEHIIANAEIIEASKKSKTIVHLASTVTILDKSDNEKAVYTIVGPVEANPTKGKISNEAPIAIALMGHSKGDVVTIKVKKPYDVEILDIK